MEPLCPLTYDKPWTVGPDTSTPLLAFDEVYIDASNLRAASAAAGRASSGAAGAAHGPITAVFLHGLLGSSRNWRSFSRRLALEAAAKANRDVRILLVDLRCHGDSAARHGFHPPHDLAAAASDVAAVIAAELGGRAPHLVVGLSLGGKIALQLLKQMVEGQESAAAAAAAAGAAGRQQQHMYAHAPRIFPPEDRPAGESCDGVTPVLSGLPQQVCMQRMPCKRDDAAAGMCAPPACPCPARLPHTPGCACPHATTFAGPLRCRCGCWTASRAPCR
jgi:pimeloyl-ACP methyl ester carboxylesterase